jgi:hypothetical protein
MLPSRLTTAFVNTRVEPGNSTKSGSVTIEEPLVP